MAKANPASLELKAPVMSEDAPVIEYRGEGAELVKFTINPKAKSYMVYASGMVVETLK